MNNASRLILGLPLSVLALMPAPGRAEAPKLPVPAVDQSAVAQRSFRPTGGSPRWPRMTPKKPTSI